MNIIATLLLLYFIIFSTVFFSEAYNTQIDVFRFLHGVIPLMGRQLSIFTADFDCLKTSLNAPSSFWATYL